MTLRIYGPARADIENVYDYIAADNTDAARQLVERILYAIEHLETSPYIGRPGRVPGTRELVITSTAYIAIYEITETGVAIARVLHGRRAWPFERHE